MLHFPNVSFFQAPFLCPMLHSSLKTFFGLGSDKNTIIPIKLHKVGMSCMLSFVTCYDSQLRSQGYEFSWINFLKSFYLSYCCNEFLKSKVLESKIY